MTIDPVLQNLENTRVNRGLTPEPYPNITGLKLQEDIILGEFVFNRIDEFGIVWVISDINGWWGVPEPEVPDYPRGNADGSYDVRGRWAARDLTLTGSFLVPDSSFVPLARQRLVDAANLVYRGAWLRVNESNYNKVAWVRLSGRPMIQTVNSRGRTDFSIGLRAPDPIKYSWNDSDPDGFDVVSIPILNDSTGALGEGVIENVGNTPVPVTFQIRGPVEAGTVLQSITRAELILVIDNIPSESTLDIGTYDNSVSLDSVFPGARSYLDPLTDWIKLNPGLNLIQFFDIANLTGGTATVDIYYRSGWIG
jgi:hypothetical protein